MSRLRHSNIVLYMGVCSEPPCLLVRPCLPACPLVWPCLARLCRCPPAALGCMPRGNCSVHQHSADAVLPMASYAMCCRWSTAAARALMTCWLGAARIPLRCVGAQLHGEGMAVSMQMHLRGRCTRCSMAGRAMPDAHCRCLRIRSRTPQGAACAGRLVRLCMASLPMLTADRQAAALDTPAVHGAGCRQRWAGQQGVGRQAAHVHWTCAV